MSSEIIVDGETARPERFNVTQAASRPNRYQSAARANPAAITELDDIKALSADFLQLELLSISPPDPLPFWTLNRYCCRQ